MLAMRAVPGVCTSSGFKAQISSFRGWAGLALVSLLLLGGRTEAQTNVLTQHNDISRTGANTVETILTPSNVNSTNFGKLFSQSVDGYVYAQPLYFSGLTMGAGTAQAGTTHNVIFVATEHDSVYAFDADNNGGANSSPLWKVSLFDSAHGGGTGEKPVPQSDVSTADIVPEIGITGTPVIDPATKTMYVVAKTTVSDTTFIQRLHALDITTGAEKFGGPVVLSGNVAGTGNGSSGGRLNFDPKWENQRPGLLLLNGIVYIGFAAHGDNGPWHGWLLAYNASTLQQTSAFVSTPNGSGSGFWMSGAGLAADVIDPVNKPFGRMFVATGNGTYDALPPFTNNEDYGDDHIRLDLTNGVMTVQDSFTPSNQASLNGGDSDVAAGGILLLPDQSTGGHQRLLVQVGKEGKIYVVDRDNMGGYSTTTDNVVQEISGQTGGLWSIPAYWNNTVYFWGSGNNLKAFSLTAGKLSTTPVSKSSMTSAFPGASPSISSNGTTNGIVWALQTDAYGSSGNAILHAFDATNVATEFFNSTQNQPGGASNAPGPAVKFAVPTVTNGKVYVGTQSAIAVYGLTSGNQQTATPVISPAGQSFTGTLSVTITDSTPGATIYFTTDGSSPSTSSTVYTGPITVSTTETISAIASATGSLTSAVAKQVYTLQTQTLAPTFSPQGGSFITAQTVTISDATPASQIYYTTDGSTPSPGVGTTQLYAAALSVSSTTTIKAIATASGLSNSPVSSATFTINAGGAGIDFSLGFSTSASSMTFNGSTGLDDTRLQLTSGVAGQAGSAWYNSQVNIQAFSTDFTLQLSNPAGDGMTFTIQGAGLTALGPSGGGLAYGPDSVTNPSPSSNTPIAKSVAVKFDLYSNSGEGPNSTGLYTNGASPTTPAIDLTSSGINLHSGDTMAVHMSYNGTVLSMTITDAVVNATFSTSWTVNIPSIVGGPTAYVGFTGATGGVTSSQKIGTWTFASNGSTPSAATPTISPAGGTYILPLTVTLADSTPGASIFYTTDGSAPTTNSTLYTAPFSQTGPGRINAFATASGYNPSPTASAIYTIQVATPIFNPAPGTYTSSQSVTITDTTPNSTIYYTLDGTTPTTSSSLYSGAVFIGTSETLTAIAVAPGLVNSAPFSGLYTINSTGGTTISFGSGFSAGSMTLLGSATLNTTKLRITDGGASEASAAWYPSPVNVQSFTTDFNFLISPGSSPTADGFAFVIQGTGLNAIGPLGGGLGYGPQTVGGTPGIGKSVAVKFDLYNNSGEGTNSTGIYTNGASPTTPATALGGGVNLHNADIFKVHMTYDGATLTMTITDTVKANQTFTTSWPINIPGIVGANNAFLGFTGGTGGLTAIQDVLSWTYVTNSGPPPTLTSIAVTPAAPSAAPGATIQFHATGTYSNNSTQDLTSTVTWASSNTAGATITAAGLATAGTAGQSTTISATLGGISGSTTLTVSGATLVSIAVTPANSSAAAGTTVQFHATGTYSNNGTQDLTSTVTWASSNTTGATITAAGLATAGTAGQSTTISATLGGISGSTTLTASAATLKSIAVTPANSSAAAGTTVQFHATGTYSNNSTQDLTSTVTWASSNTTGATITAAGLAT
ncbi:MAG TPA: chitobiase/beta-hexosaminidase C-terminal domain-containing protein, partial [Candidatus Acidoferrum sp.]|nr:chitobiase/beta-hexosaminidase C-terminal domain-containing protein [Candidatus Acidoferrum sp.]